MNKAQYFLRKHSSTILTVVGATGVVVTTALAVKATPKALTLIEEAKKEKGDELSTKETIKVAWKPYIPAVVSGVSTIACIFGINYLSTKNQANLMSAYALLDNSYKEYRKKVEELYGEEADVNVQTEIAKQEMTKNNDIIELEEGESLFFDFYSRTTFKSTMKDVLSAESEFLESFVCRGYACINEYYEILGLPPTKFGYQLGWLAVEDNDPYNCNELEFNYEKTEINGVECWIITTNIPPATDYIF